ncbi:MAG: three-Cys-motif partner protein TcmP [Phycisphaerae bacterium]|nr:three-Cys-motif partner protein TcmP [Tepidisphaeraceae bacterium]
MSELYEGREQARVKHAILRKYLERFAHVIGMGHSRAITYVDGFSGPWSAQSDDYSDTSFGIALQELRKARATCNDVGKPLQLRCFFVEKDRKAFAQLSRFAASVGDGIEIETKCSSLAAAVPDILRFVNASSPRSFPFFFLDPKGWSALEYAAIEPLIRLDPGEILVNFMSEFIRRFIEVPHPDVQDSFDRMFGPFKPPPTALKGLQSEDLDDVLVDAYAELLRRTGNFDYVCRAIILRPESDRTLYHLIYATRHWKGVQEFKKAEGDGMDVQESTRAEVKSRRKAGDAPFLFSASVMDDPRHYERLRSRYLSKARAKVAALIKSHASLAFEEVWATALSEPIVQQADLDAWISEWRARGQVVIAGMAPKQRVCRCGQGLRIESSVSFRD